MQECLFPVATHLFRWAHALPFLGRRFYTLLWLLQLVAAHKAMADSLNAGNYKALRNAIF